MNTEEQKQNIKEEILQKIQNGEVKMRPKAFFIVKIAALIFVAFTTFVVSVLLVSYTWFNLKTGGHIFLLSFGGRGFYEFFILFPWILLVLDVGLIVLLDWLIKRFRFAYHNPVLYVFVGSLLLITIGGTVINMTSFHKSIMRRAEEKQLPIPGVSGFYTGLRKTHMESGLFRGEIISVATSSFFIKNGRYDMDDSTSSIEVITPDGFNVQMILSIGDEVFVAGDFADSSIRAYGVRKLTLDD